MAMIKSHKKVRGWVTSVAGRNTDYKSGWGFIMWFSDECCEYFGQPE